MAEMEGQAAPSRRPVKQREATRLESIDEIRKAIKARRAPAPADGAQADDTTPFRPVRRPPMALLCILDDGGEDGQWVRLWGDRYVIGRSEGDIVVPHDPVMSGRHAELARQLESGVHRWHLIDLASTNGTYVRVGSALLKSGQEMLLGGRRYRFDLEKLHDAPVSGTEPGAARETSGWEPVSPADLFPSLVELTSRGEGQRFLLSQEVNWLGRDARLASLVLADDPLVSPQHARIYRDSKGRWHIENARSLNGTWLRIEHMILDGACQFQLGEQRFLWKGVP